MNTWKYFKPEEVVGLDIEFVSKMDMGRHVSGVAWKITDGKRTAATNTDPNAVKDSAHLTGHAADIDCNDYHTLWAIMAGCFAAKINRIGVYVQPDPANKTRLVPTHVHLDDDKTKDPEVIWITIEK